MSVYVSTAHTHTHIEVCLHRQMHTCTFLASVLEMYALTKSQSSLSVGEGKKMFVFRLVCNEVLSS